MGLTFYYYDGLQPKNKRGNDKRAWVYLGNIVIHFQVTHFMWKKLCLLMELNFVSMSDTQIYHDNFVRHWIFQYPWPPKKCDFRNQANLVFEVVTLNIQGTKVKSGKSFCSEFGRNQSLYWNKQYLNFHVGKSTIEF